FLEIGDCPRTPCPNWKKPTGRSPDASAGESLTHCLHPSGRKSSPPLGRSGRTSPVETHPVSSPAANASSPWLLRPRHRVRLSASPSDRSRRIPSSPAGALAPAAAGTDCRCHRRHPRRRPVGSSAAAGFAALAHAIGSRRKTKKSPLPRFVKQKLALG